VASHGRSTLYRQGYLSPVKERVVRVRIAGDRGFLANKELTTGGDGLSASARFRFPTRR
jgi:CYTH domain-containing protein